MIFKNETIVDVLITTVRGIECPRCTGSLGIGLKEEPTGWKVYTICTAEKTYCPQKQVGLIPRGSIDHLDDLTEEAEQLLKDYINR